MPKRKKSQAASKHQKKAMKLSLVPETPTTKDLINNLDDDCLLKIFNYFSISDRLQVDMVCRRWRGVCRMASKDLKILDFSKCRLKKSDLYQLPMKFRTNQGVGMILKKFGGYVQQLKLGHPCNFNILPIVGQHCSNLTRLEIDFYGYNKSCAKYFPRLQKLKYFEISNIKCYPREVFQTLPSDTLTELHLRTYEQHGVLSYLPRGSIPLIAPTAIENFTKLTAISLNGFDLKPNMIEIINNKSNLKSLSLEDSLCRGGLPRLTALTNLEHLNLGLNRQVDDGVLTKISECCKNLKSLNVRACTAITDQGIKSLGDLPQLEKLVLNRIRYITGTCLWTLHNLKRIDCHGCDSICDDAIIKLMRNALELESLDVIYSNVTSNVLEVANEISRQRNTPLQIAISRSVNRSWYGDDHPLLIIREEEYAEFFM